MREARAGISVGGMYIAHPLHALAALAEIVHNLDLAVDQLADAVPAEWRGSAASAYEAIRAEAQVTASHLSGLAADAEAAVALFVAEAESMMPL